MPARDAERGHAGRFEHLGGAHGVVELQAAGQAVVAVDAHVASALVGIPGRPLRPARAYNQPSV